MNLSTLPNCAHETPRAERIALLNDGLRKTASGGTIVMTRGVQSLAEFEALSLLNQLSAYDDFDLDNDPHGERDFGAMDVWGAELLWKIDYYAPDLLFGSDDPADPAKTHRVLTVMLAEEY